MTLLLFIAVLVVLIVVHEFGHFSVAKLFRIRVEEFGIGYPPRAFTLGRIGETMYTINWLPFGGFVRIFGESHEEEIREEDKKRAFVGKPLLVQAAVLIAGVTFNALFAWFLFTLTLMLGAPTAVSEAQAQGLDTRLIVSSVVPGTPADSAGLLGGDEIVGIAVSGGDAIEKLTPSFVSVFIQQQVGKTLTFSYVRGESSEALVQDVTITPAHGVLEETPGTPAVGIAMALIADKSMPFHQAIFYGASNTISSLVSVTKGLSTFFVSAVRGVADFSQIAGPVGIVGLVGDASSIGLVYLLYFTAFISVNLAVINLLPLPALDGGRLLFIAIEAIKGSPLNKKVSGFFNVVGFGALIVLMLVVTYHDILRLFS